MSLSILDNTHTPPGKCGPGQFPLHYILYLNQVPISALPPQSSRLPTCTSGINSFTSLCLKSVSQAIHSSSSSQGIGCILSFSLQNLTCSVDKLISIQCSALAGLSLNCIYAPELACQGSTGAGRGKSSTHCSTEGPRQRQPHSTIAWKGWGDHTVQPFLVSLSPIPAIA